MKNLDTSEKHLLRAFQLYSKGESCFSFPFFHFQFTLGCAVFWEQRKSPPSMCCRDRRESPPFKKENRQILQRCLLRNTSVARHNSSPRAGSLPFRFLWSVKKKPPKKTPQSLQALFSASHAKNSFLVPEVGHTQAS